MAGQFTASCRTDPQSVGSSMYHTLLIRICVNGTKSFCLYGMSDSCASDCMFRTVLLFVRLWGSQAKFTQYTMSDWALRFIMIASPVSLPQLINGEAENQSSYYQWLWTSVWIQFCGEKLTSSHSLKAGHFICLRSRVYVFSIALIMADNYEI